MEEGREMGRWEQRNSMLANVFLSRTSIKLLRYARDARDIGGREHTEKRFASQSYSGCFRVSGANMQPARSNPGSYECEATSKECLCSLHAAGTD